MKKLKGTIYQNKTKTRIVKQIFTILTFVLLFGFLLILVFPSIPINFLGLRFFLVANTKSMHPMLQYNDMIVVRRVNFNNLQVDDIVTFNSKTSISGQVHNIVITHNIIEKTYHPVTNERAFITSGINLNISQDARLLTEFGVGDTNSFIGIVSFRSRFLGNIIAYLASPFGITMVVINAGVIVILILLFKKERQVTV